MKKKYFLSGILIGLLIALLVLEAVPALSRSEYFQNLVKNAIRSHYTFDEMVDLYEPSADELADHISALGLQQNFFRRFGNYSTSAWLRTLNISDDELMSHLASRYTSSEILTKYNEAISKHSALAKFLN